MCTIIIIIHVAVLHTQTKFIHDSLAMCTDNEIAQHYYNNTSVHNHVHNQSSSLSESPPGSISYPRNTYSSLRTGSLGLTGLSNSKPRKWKLRRICFRKASGVEQSKKMKAYLQCSSSSAYSSRDTKLKGDGARGNRQVIIVVPTNKHVILTMCIKCMHVRSSWQQWVQARAKALH